MCIQPCISAHCANFQRSFPLAHFSMNANENNWATRATYETVYTHANTSIIQENPPNEHSSSPIYAQSICMSCYFNRYLCHHCDSQKCDFIIAGASEQKLVICLQSLHVCTSSCAHTIIGQKFNRLARHLRWRWLWCENLRLRVELPDFTHIFGQFALHTPTRSHPGRPFFKFRLRPLIKRK